MLFSIATVVAFISTAHATTLAPVVHATLNTSDTTHLEPKTAIKLSYTDSNPSTPNVTIANVTIPQTAYPAVVLDHSDLVSNFQCLDDTLSIGFASQTAYQVAETNWIGQFMLITSDPSCFSNISSNARDYLLVQQISFSNLTATAKVTQIDFQKAVDPQTEVTVQFSKMGLGSSNSSTVSKRADIDIFNTDITIDTPVGSASTTWGNGTLLYSDSYDGADISIYCVECGVTASLEVEAVITFTLAKGITNAYLSVGGPITATLQVGVVAEYANTWTFTQPIASVALSPLSIPDVITLGPEIALDAGGSLTVDVIGEVLAGAILTWPDAEASLDITNISSSSSSGWTPTPTPVFQVDGSVGATAAVFLQLTVGFGVDILSGTFTDQLALIEKPSLSVTADISGQAALDNGTVTGSIGTSTCNGVELSVDFENDLTADLLSITTIDINTFKANLYSTCIAV